MLVVQARAVQIRIFQYPDIRIVISDRDPKSGYRIENPDIPFSDIRKSGYPKIRNPIFSGYYPDIIRISEIRISGYYPKFGYPDIRIGRTVLVSTGHISFTLNRFCYQVV